MVACSPATIIGAYRERDFALADRVKSRIADGCGVRAKVQVLQRLARPAKWRKGGAVVNRMYAELIQRGYFK